MDDDEENGAGAAGEDGSGESNANGDEGQTSATPTDEPPPINREPDYGNWFADVPNYGGGVVVYAADRDSVTVSVGGDDHVFDEPSIAVAVGTTVVWEWTDGDSAHNVVGVDGRIDSGDPVADSSRTFSHQFDEPGTYRYACEPHEGEGMKGAVSVYEPET